MEPKGRSRGRGRSTGSGQAPGGGHGPRPGPPYQRSGNGQSSRGSRSQPPQQMYQPPMPVPAPAREFQTQQPYQPSQRAPAPSTSVEHAPRTVEGQGDGQPSTRGNGGVRGRTLRSEIIFTKPTHVARKQGSSGNLIQLSANYFPLLQAGKWGLNQYRADFSPDIDHTGQKKGLMRSAMQGVLNGYLFDGTALYTPQRLHPDPMEKFVETENGDKIRITLRMVGDVAWGDYHYIQLFNIIIRKCLNFMKFQLVGRDYYDPRSKINMNDHKLELWPGFTTSMRQHEQNILLNCDVAFKIMRNDNVYDLLMECRSGNPRAEFQSKIIGSTVLTYYNNRTYRIDDIDYSSKPTSTFPMKDGKEISFVEYYKRKYNINIQVQNQPLLVSRSKPREIRAGMPETVLLIPELCQLTGLTDQQRENFHLMRALADHTRIGPPQRIAKLREFSNRMSGCPEVMAELRRWDLNIANDLIRFQGRALPPEQIVGGNNAKYSAGPQADWTRDLRSTPMFEAGVMERFAVVCPVKFKRECQDFIQILQRAARGMSWDFGSPRIFDIPDDRTATYLENIENLINRSKPTLIMVVLPNNSNDRYGSIKKKCCVDRGISTQVIVARNLSSKGVMSIATKVAIQLNCKIGGSPWTVNLPLSNLMIVGYDVCRDTANKGMSFAGMVASLNKQATRYFNYTAHHKMEEELSENFSAFLLIACQKFKELNGRYPERILIYRDGVGEGQLPYVIEHEVASIKQKLTQEIYKNNDLRLAFVVVSKRINARIFGDRGNPPPGTVVDDVITLPERYDFYIVSQCVRQGTVAPTSYNVIEDTMGLPPDRMQILTYKMCHMYYNWSGTVRVPAPCQYAHKLAFLTAQSLHRPAHRALENVLYYL